MTSELRRYAAIFESLTPGEIHPATTFVDWLIQELEYESRPTYRAPAGRPGQMKATAA